MIDVQCYNRQRVYGAKILFPVIRETAEHVLFLSFCKQLLKMASVCTIDVTMVDPRIMRKSIENSAVSMN